MTISLSISLTYLVVMRLLWGREAFSPQDFCLLKDVCVAVRFGIPISTLILSLLVRCRHIYVNTWKSKSNAILYFIMVFSSKTNFALWSTLSSHPGQTRGHQNQLRCSCIWFLRWRKFWRLPKTRDQLLCTVGEKFFL